MKVLIIAEVGQEGSVMKRAKGITASVTDSRYLQLYLEENCPDLAQFKEWSVELDLILTDSE